MRSRRRARLLRVVAEEIDRLANFTERIGERLARLALRQIHQLAPIRLEQIGRAFKQRGPRRSRRRGPRRRKCLRGGQGGGDLGRTRIGDTTDQASGGGIDHIPGVALVATSPRCARPCACKKWPRHARALALVRDRRHIALHIGLHCALNFAQCRLIVQIQSLRISARAAEHIRRQRHLRMWRAARRSRGRDRIGHELCETDVGINDAMDER